MKNTSEDKPRLYAMRIIYACSFDLSGVGGKERATRQKIQALKNLGHNVNVIAPRGLILRFRFLLFPLVELVLCMRLFVFRADVLISRGYIGFIAQKLARRLGVLSVREVHADALGELPLTAHRGWRLKIIERLTKIAIRTDVESDVIIFNHPFIMEWFHKKYGNRELDGFVYNGYSVEAAAPISKMEARRKFGLPEDRFVLVFVGAASEWHGIEYLVSLQKEFERHGDPCLIVCGGGRVSQRVDPERLLRNISPLDDAQCAQLIRASDLCLLPVKLNRVSPGSPLKLYDYVVNGVHIAAQKDLPGYSDEVDRYRLGLCVDFRDAIAARAEIVEFLCSGRSTENLVIPDLSWEARMKEWLAIIHKARHHVECAKQ